MLLCLHIRRSISCIYKGWFNSVSCYLKLLLLIFSIYFLCIERVVSLQQEVSSGDHERTGSTVTAHMTTSQEQEGSQDSREDNNEVGVQEERKRRAAEGGRGETDDIEEMKEKGQGRIETNIKIPVVEDDSTSLMEHMNLAWHRVSGLFLLPPNISRKVSISTTVWAVG